MRRLLLVIVAVAAAGSASRGEEPTTERTDPRLPNIPGAFHPFNVTGAHKGRYHSRISEFGLEPMIMIFTRQSEFGGPLRDLLTDIDGVVEKNPTARLHPFVVVQSADLPEVVGATDQTDDQRLQLNKALEDAVDKLMLKHIDVDLAGKTDLEKFNLDDKSFAFFLFQRGKVTASRVLSKEEKLTDADVQAIMALDVSPFGPQNTAIFAVRDGRVKRCRRPALLKGLDDAAEKNPAARLHPFVVALSDDPKRSDLEAALADKVRELKLQHVIAVAAGASEIQPKAWKLQQITAAAAGAKDDHVYDVKDAPFAFLLVQSGKVIGGRMPLKGETFGKAASDDVMKILADKAGADKQ